MQRALYFIISLTSFVGFSQDADILRGKIVTDTLQSKSINIINITKGIGTINDRVGFFQIRATQGDTIVFSSVQYQQKTHIVTKKDLKQANLSIQLQVKVNELEEVMVSQYDLTGEAKEDVKKIKTYEKNLPMFNAKMLDETQFIHEKGAKTVKNRVVTDEMDATPINIIAVGRMIASLFKKKDARQSKEVRIPEVSDFYNSDFLVSELKIPETELYDFLDYLNQKLETRKVLKSGDRLRILEYLINQSKIFNTTNALKN
ncbi:hypothetical protein [Aquimarina rubra]|uniref:Carboxypeptidase-like regulatory domain-containing protein n=1 Tax=Aquimarina rubra TaxID=1920033 RepID=A0ABW5LHT6_9FLAO